MIRGKFREWLERRAAWYSGYAPGSEGWWTGKILGASSVYTTSGVAMDRHRALTLSAIWSAVNLISGAIGYMPVKVFRNTGNGKEVAIDHAVYPLLHLRANPYMDRMTLFETMMGHVLMHGNAYAEIERSNNGIPIALWIIPPTRMSVTVTRGIPTYLVHADDRKDYALSPKDVLHVKGLGFDGIKGYSVIEYAADNWALAAGTEEFGARFFRNGVSPCGTLETDGVLQPKTFEALEKAFNVGNTGLINAGKPLVLQHGLKWHQIGIPPEQAQYLASRKFSTEDVARWFNVPAYMLQQDSNQTRATIEQKSSDFVQWCLMPWCERWESELNIKLFGDNEREEYCAEFIPQSLLRADMKTQAEVSAIYLQNGVFNVNEVRRTLNMNDIPEGDEYRKPMNLAPLTPSGNPNQPDTSKNPAKQTTDGGEDDNG